MRIGSASTCLGLVVLLSCSAAPVSKPPTLLRAKATLFFEQLNNGEFAANFDLEFRNTTGKALCVNNGIIPGSDGFDASAIEFVGPRGTLKVEPLDPFKPGVGTPPIGMQVGRYIVIFRNSRVHTGVRILKDDYVFSDRGLYTATLRIDTFDCSKLNEMRHIADYPPGWFLGQIEAKATAILK